MAGVLLDDPVGSSAHAVLVLMGLALVSALRAALVNAKAVATAPSLVHTVGATQTPAFHTVTGEGFTAGGRAYLAVYHRMGAKVYETPWDTASSARAASGEES